MIIQLGQHDKITGKGWVAQENQSGEEGIYILQMTSRSLRMSSAAVTVR